MRKAIARPLFKRRVFFLAVCEIIKGNRTRGERIWNVKRT
jgi:hypothetical protein